MPAPNNPEHDTPAAIWGSELRYYREAAGLSQEELAERINYSRSLVQAVESGARTPVPAMAKACDEALDTGGALLRLHEKLLKQAAFRQSFQRWPDIEQGATVLRGYESMVFPGLLQVPEYTRLIMRAGGEDVVAATLERQEILTKDKPPSVRFVIDEWVLSRPVGGPEVMVAQLERIEEAITSGQVSVQISPAGSVLGASGSFVLATLDGETVAYQEAYTDGMVMTLREDVLTLEAVYDEIIAEALPSGASLELIRRMKKQWQQT